MENIVPLVLGLVMILFNGWLVRLSVKLQLKLWGVRLNERLSRVGLYIAGIVLVVYGLTSFFGKVQLMNIVLTVIVLLIGVTFIIFYRWLARQSAEFWSRLLGFSISDKIFQFITILIGILFMITGVGLFIGIF